MRPKNRTYKALLTATALAALALLGGGCAGPEQSQPAAAATDNLFAPVSMRLHPIFTQIKDYSANGQPDGIEALVELQDSFGDPAKAAGRVLFELYEFRRGWPDPRGNRVCNPWIASVATLEEQKAHWNRTSRTYGFDLACPPLRNHQSYVLTATFELAGGGRFFDRLVLQAGESPSANPATAATRPAELPELLTPPVRKAPPTTAPATQELLREPTSLPVPVASQPSSRAPHP